MWLHLILWPLLLLFLIFLRDERENAAPRIYADALRLFQQGKLKDSQAEARASWERYRAEDGSWARKFLLLEAESLLSERRNQDVLTVLDSYPDQDAAAALANGAVDDFIEKLSIEGLALARNQNGKEGEAKLAQAEVLCDRRRFLACGNVMTSRAIVAKERNDVPTAREYFIQAYSFAKAHRDDWRQAAASLNLGVIALQGDRYDEAIDWSRSAFEKSMQMNYERLAKTSAGNLGFAYYELGDRERALEIYLEAGDAARREGDAASEITWLNDAGYVYRDKREFSHAEEVYRRSLTLARGIDSKEDIQNALSDMVMLALYENNAPEAEAHLNEALRMETAGGHPPRPTFVLMQAKLAALKHEDMKAEGMYREVLADKATRTEDRLGAGEDLGGLYERASRPAAAERTYRAAIDTWEAARAELQHEESQLSYGTNVAGLYGSLIRLLVSEGRTGEALAEADRSRARTLEAGLGVLEEHLAARPEALHPEQIARKSGATLLFYWLGAQESYLWAVTPARTEFFKLPAGDEIAARIERYNRAILDLKEGEPAARADGAALYRELVAPAAKAVDAAKPVIVLADGELNQLNFETLPVEGGDSAGGDSARRAKPGTSQDSGASPHYLIEDWTIVSAPSLDLLAHGAEQDGTRGADHDELLLMGNPSKADAEFPPLPHFGAEMQRVRSHFPDADVMEGASATPAAYAKADPGRFAYIHFVSHAIASRTVPLDSAIILSNPVQAGAGAIGAYKLYAREIVKHRLAARLVTISACYGSGTRAFAGEGLIGLSWAFLRAGARQVVAALWEVDDESTPRLMDRLYAGIEAGRTPAAALREAKLALLHSGTKFAQPYYWAPFVIYGRE